MNRKEQFDYLVLRANNALEAGRTDDATQLIGKASGLRSLKKGTKILKDLRTAVKAAVAAKADGDDRPGPEGVGGGEVDEGPADVGGVSEDTEPEGEPAAGDPGEDGPETGEVD